MTALNQSVLILNKNYFAVQVASAQKVLSLLFQEAAEVVDAATRTYNFADWCELSAQMRENPSGFVRTVTLKIAVPDVVRLLKYDRLPKAEVKFTRQNIYTHYKNLCSYCGKKFSTKELNLDHIIPKSRGGKTNWNNIVPACFLDNTKKSNRTPAEAGMELLVTPSQPRWRGHQSLLAVNLPMAVRESWRAWIDRAYWNAELEEDN